MHWARAVALHHVLELSESCPVTVACPREQTAPRNRLTVDGPVRLERACYSAPRTIKGEVRMTGTGHRKYRYSPGVGRMMALVSSDASFYQGRERMPVAGEHRVTRKVVEQHAEPSARCRTP